MKIEQAVAEWREVEGTNGAYAVSSDGQVMSMPRNVKCCYGSTRLVKKKLLTISKSAFGYSVVKLRTENFRGNKFVHRLVAAAFVPKTPGKEFVNHKNFIRTDNRAENLEWVTAKENNLHTVKNGRWRGDSNRRRAVQLSKDGIAVVHASVFDAADAIACSYHTIYTAIRLNRAVKGHKVQYVGSRPERITPRERARRARERAKAIVT